MVFSKAGEIERNLIHHRANEALKGEKAVAYKAKVFEAKIGLLRAFKRPISDEWYNILNRITRSDPNITFRTFVSQRQDNFFILA
jgi:hypothetical protein